jgi:opacity protein-like surface antigen
LRAQRLEKVGATAAGLGLLAGLLIPCEAFAGDWAVIAEQKVLYTDNVFELSSARRLTLAEDPSQPTVVNADRPSDVVVEPALEITRSFTSGRQQTDLSLKAHGFLFTQNPIFNHGTYRIQVKHAWSPETSLLLRYRYVPNQFLGVNNERQSGLRLLEEERVTSHIIRAQLERHLATDWAGTFVARYGLRAYNEVFSERDTRFYTLGPQLQWSALPRLSVTVAYLYERGLSDGRDQPQFADDISYRQHFASIGTEIGFAEALSLRLQYGYRRKEFTSELAGDTHLGRHDDTHQGTAELGYRLTEAATLTLGFQRTQRTSTNASKDFFDTNTSLGVRYRFH